MFAECCVFVKQSQPPGYCGWLMLDLCRFHTLQRTFSRSYGTILPSSFTRVLSSALVYSTRPPVSVSGTDFPSLTLEAFPGSLASVPSADFSASSQLSSIGNMHLTHHRTTAFHCAPSGSAPSLLRHSIETAESTGILTCFPSTTLFSLALGSDSPCPD